MTNVVKETIELKVRVRITYDNDNKETRKEAIKRSKEMVVSSSSWGYPVSSNPYFASIIK